MDDKDLDIPQDNGNEKPVADPQAYREGKKLIVPRTRQVLDLINQSPETEAWTNFATKSNNLGLNKLAQSNVSGKTGTQESAGFNKFLSDDQKKFGFSSDKTIQDLRYERADEQSGFPVINIAGRLISGTVTKAAAGLIWTGAATYDYFAKGDPNTRNTGPYVKKIEEVQHYWEDEMFPILRRRSYDEATNLWTAMSHFREFAGGDVNDGVQFMLGAAIPGQVLGKIGALANAGKVAKIGAGVGYGMFQAIGEAGMESRGVYDSVRETYENKINPETGELYTGAEADALATAASDRTARTNFIALAGLNAFQYKFILPWYGKAMRKSMQSMRAGVASGKTTSEGFNVMRKTLKDGTLAAVSETAQELFQTGITKTEEDLANGKLSKYDFGQYVNAFIEGVYATGKGLSGSSMNEREMEFAKSGILGGLIGGGPGLVSGYSAAIQKKADLLELETEWKSFENNFNIVEKNYFENDRSILKSFSEEVDVVDADGNPTGEKETKSTFVNPATGKTEIDQQKAMKAVYQSVWEKQIFDRIIAAAMDENESAATFTREVALSGLAYQYAHALKGADSWGKNPKTLIKERFKQELENAGELNEEQIAELKDQESQILEYLEDWKKIEDNYSSKDETRGTDEERSFAQNYKKILFYEQARQKAFKKEIAKAEETGNTKLKDAAQKLLDDSESYVKKMINNKSDFKDLYLESVNPEKAIELRVDELIKKRKETTDPAELEAIDKETRALMYAHKESVAINYNPFMSAQMEMKDQVKNPNLSAKEQFYYNQGMAYRVNNSVELAKDEITAKEAELVELQKKLAAGENSTAEIQQVQEEINKLYAGSFDTIKGNQAHATEETQQLVNDLKTKAENRKQNLIRSFENSKSVVEDLNNREKEKKEFINNNSQGSTQKIRQAFGKLRTNQGTAFDSAKQNMDSFSNEDLIQLIKDELSEPSFDESLWEIADDLEAGLQDKVGEIIDNAEDGTITAEEKQMLLEGVLDLLLEEMNAGSVSPEVKEAQDQLEELERMKTTASLEMDRKAKEVSDFENAIQSSSQAAQETADQGKLNSNLKLAEEAKNGTLDKALQKEYAEAKLKLVKNQEDQYEADPEVYDNEGKLIKMKNELQGMQAAYEGRVADFKDAQKHQDFMDEIQRNLDLIDTLVEKSRDNRGNKRAKQNAIAQDRAIKAIAAIGFRVTDQEELEEEDPELVDIFRSVIGSQKLTDLLDSAKQSDGTVNIEAYEVIAEVALELFKNAATKENLETLNEKINNNELNTAIELESYGVQENIAFLGFDNYLRSPIRAFKGVIMNHFLQAFGPLFKGSREALNPFFLYDETNDVDQLQELIKNNKDISDELKAQALAVINLHKKYVSNQKLRSAVNSDYSFSDTHLEQDKLLMEIAKSGSKKVPTKEQSFAFRAVIEAFGLPLGKSKDRFSKAITFLRGPAGSGKTKFALRWAIRSLGLAQNEIYAFSHKEATSKGIADSVQGVKGSLQNFLGMSEEKLNDLKVIIIDEAPFFDNPNLRNIEEKLKKENERRLKEKKAPLRMILLGDPGQITREGTGSVLLTSSHYRQMNIIDPLTQTYRSEVPAIISIQNMFRRKSEKVRGVSAVSSTPIGVGVDSKGNKVVGVQSGASVENLQAALEANKDSGRSKVIIVNDQQSKLNFTNDPLVKDLMGRSLNGLPMLEVLTYDEAQGQTFSEVYVNLDINGRDMTKNPFLRGNNYRDFNQAMYTALSRAEDYIFVVDAEVEALVDDSLVEETKKGSEETDANFSDFSEKMAMETEILGKFIDGHAEATTKQEAEGATTTVTEPPIEITPEDNEDPEGYVPEELSPEEIQEGVEDNETTEPETTSTDYVGPTPITHVEEDSNDMHELEHPENAAAKPDRKGTAVSYPFSRVVPAGTIIEDESGNPLEVPMSSPVIYVKIFNPKTQENETHVFGQSQTYGTFGNNQWIKLGVIGLKDQKKPFYKKHVYGNARKATNDSTIAEYNEATGELSGVGNEITYDATGRAVVVPSGNADSVVFFGGELAKARSIGFKWGQDSMLKGFIDHIKEQFQKNFFKASQNGPQPMDFEIKIYTRKELESDPDLKRRAHQLKAGVPYFRIKNPKMVGAISKVTDMIIRLTPRGLMREDLKAYLKPVRELYDEAKALSDRMIQLGAPKNFTVGDPLVNALIQKIATAKKNGKRSIEVGDKGEILFKESMYTWEDLQADIKKNYPELEGADTITQPMFDAIDAAARNIIPLTYGSSEGKIKVSEAEKEEYLRENPQVFLEEIKRKGSTTKEYYAVTNDPDQRTPGEKSDYLTEVMPKANRGPAQVVLNSLAKANTKAPFSVEDPMTKIRSAKKALSLRNSFNGYRTALQEAITKHYEATYGKDKAKTELKGMHRAPLADIEKTYDTIMKSLKKSETALNLKEQFTQKRMGLQELEQLVGDKSYDSEGNHVGLPDGSYLQVNIGMDWLKNMNKKLTQGTSQERQEAVEAIEKQMGTKFETVQGAQMIVRESGSVTQQQAQKKAQEPAEPLIDKVSKKELDTLVEALRDNTLALRVMETEFTPEVIQEILDAYQEKYKGIEREFNLDRLMPSARAYIESYTNTLLETFEQKLEEIIQTLMIIKGPFTNTQHFEDYVDDFMSRQKGLTGSLYRTNKDAFKEWALSVLLSESPNFQIGAATSTNSTTENEQKDLNDLIRAGEQLLEALLNKKREVAKALGTDSSVMDSVEEDHREEFRAAKSDKNQLVDLIQNLSSSLMNLEQVEEENIIQLPEEIQDDLETESFETGDGLIHIKEEDPDSVTGYSYFVEDPDLGERLDSTQEDYERAKEETDPDFRAYMKKEGDKPDLVSTKEIIRLVKRMLPGIKINKSSWIKSKLFSFLGIPTSNEIELQFVSQAFLDALTGTKDTNRGLYSKGVIYLLKDMNGKVDQRIMRHEVFHKVFNEYLSRAERKALKMSAKRIDPMVAEMGPIQFEEWLADLFMAHKNKQITLKGRLLNFMNNSLRLFGFISSSRTEVGNLMKMIDEGYFVKKKSIDGRFKQRSFKDIKDKFGSIHNFQQAIKILEKRFNSLATFDPKKKITKVFTYEELYAAVRQQVVEDVKIKEELKVKYEDALASTPATDVAKLERLQAKIDKLTLELAPLESLLEVENFKLVTDYLFPSSIYSKKSLKIGFDVNEILEINLINEDDSFSESLQGVNLKDVIDSAEEQDNESSLSVAVKFLLSNIYNTQTGKTINGRLAFAKLLGVMESLSFEQETVVGKKTSKIVTFKDRLEESVREVAGLSTEDNLEEAGDLFFLYQRIMSHYNNAVKPNFKHGKDKISNMDPRFLFVDENTFVFLNSPSATERTKMRRMTKGELAHYISKKGNEGKAIVYNRSQTLKAENKRRKQEGKEKLAHLSTEQFAAIVGSKINQLRNTLSQPLSEDMQIDMITNHVRASFRQEQSANSLREFGTLFTSMRSKNLYIAKLDGRKNTVTYIPAGTVGNSISVRESIVEGLVSLFKSYSSNKDATVADEIKVREGLERFKNTSDWKEISTLLDSASTASKVEGIKKFLNLLGMKSYGNDPNTANIIKLAPDIKFLIEKHLTDGKLGTAVEVSPLSDEEVKGMSDEEIEAYYEPTYIDLRSLVAGKANSINNLAKEISKSSSWMRATSVKDTKGNTVYMHHNSTQADDTFVLFSKASKDKLGGAVGSRQWLRLPEYFTKSKFMKENIFIKGINKIVNIIDHDGMKNDYTGKGTDYTSESKFMWLSRNLNAGFASIIKTSSSRNITYAQWIYTPSNRPRTKGAIVGFLGKEGIKKGIGQYLKQIGERSSTLKNFVANYDKYKNINFEALDDVIARYPSENGETFVEKRTRVLDNIKGNEQDFDTLVDLVYGRLGELSKEFAKDLHAEQFKFSSNFNEVYSKLLEAGLIDEDMAVDPGIPGMKELYRTYPLGGQNKYSHPRKGYNLSPEMIHAATDMMFKNNYINSFFLNQSVSGDFSFFKNSFDVVKRLSGVFAPGQKGVVNDMFGMKKKFRMAILKDPEVGRDGIKSFLAQMIYEKATYESLEDSEKAELEPLLSRFGNGFELADAQGFMLPERAEDLERGFGRAYGTGNVFKGAHYENVMKKFRARESKLSILQAGTIFYAMEGMNLQAMKDYHGKSLAIFEENKDLIRRLKADFLHDREQGDISDDVNFEDYMNLNFTTRNNSIKSSIKKALKEQWSRFKTEQEAKGNKIVTNSTYILNQFSEDFSAAIKHPSESAYVEMFDDSLKTEKTNKYRQMNGTMSVAKNASQTPIIGGYESLEEFFVETDSLGENESYEISHDGKVYVSEESSVPVMIKYSSVVLSEELRGKYPALRLLAEKMRASKVDEVVMASGNKIGKPTEAMSPEDTMSTEDSKMFFPENSVYSMSNENYRLQSNPDHITFDSKKGVANPSQLGYFLSILKDLVDDYDSAETVYSTFANLIMRGDSRFDKLIQNENGQIDDAKVQALFRDLMNGEGNERYAEFLAQGISVNAPHMVNKAVSQLMSKITRMTIAQRFPGEKLTLQSAYGIKQNIDPKSYENYKDAVEKGEELKYFVNEEGHLEAETIMAKGILPASVEAEILKKLENGEKVYMMPDMMGFRIPSTEIHSAVALRIVGFYDSRGTAMVIAPKELVALHGSDFDVDSLFVIVRNHLSKAEKALFKNLFPPTKVGEELTEAEELSGIPKEFEKDTPIGYKKNEKGEFIIDVKGFGETLNKLAATLTDPKDLKTLDSLRDKFDMNIILEAFLSTITDSRNRKRMINPISMALFSGEELDEKTTSGFLKGSVFDTLSDLQVEKVQAAYDEGLLVDTEGNPISEDELDFLIQKARDLRENVDLSNFQGNYAVFKSNMDGRSLTGIFANIVKALSYMVGTGHAMSSDSKSSEYSRRLLQEQTKLKSLKEELKLTRENMLASTGAGPLKILHARIARLEKNIASSESEIKTLNEEIEKNNEGKSKTFAPYLTQSEGGRDKSLKINGKVLNRLVERIDDILSPGNKVPIWDVFDALINAAIDNVKEQILPIINANNLTANPISAMLALGVSPTTISLITTQSTIKALDPFGSRDLQVATLRKNLLDLAKTMMGPAISKMKPEEFSDFIEEELAKIEVNDELLRKLQINGNLDTRYLGTTDSAMVYANVMEEYSVADIILEHVAVLNEFEKAMQIGEDISTMSSQLKILKSNPSNKGDINALNEKWDNFAEEQEDGTLSINPSFSFNIPNFFAINPHIKVALEVFKKAKALVERLFLKHNPKIEELVESVWSRAKIGLDYNKYENFEMLKNEFVRYVFSGIPMMKSVNEPKRYLGAKKVRVGSAGWSTEFAAKAKLLQDYFRKNNISNAFIENLVFKQLRYGDKTIDFTAGSGLRYEDTLIFQEAFEALKEFRVEKGVVTPNTTSEEFSELQHDFVKYAINNFGMQFGSMNYSLALPAPIIKPYIEEMEAEFKKLLKNQDALDVATDLFTHQAALNHGFNLPTVKGLPVKQKTPVSGKEMTSSYDADLNIYYSLKFKTEDIRNKSDYIIYGGTVYMQIAEGEDHTYFQKIGKPNDRTFYIPNDNFKKPYSVSHAFNPHIIHKPVETWGGTSLKLSETYGDLAEGTVIATSLLTDVGRYEIRYVKIKQKTKEFTKNPAYDFLEATYSVEAATKEDVEQVGAVAPLGPIKVTKKFSGAGLNFKGSGIIYNKTGKKPLREVMDEIESNGSEGAKQMLGFLRDQFGDMLDEVQVKFYSSGNRGKLGFWRPSDPKTIHVKIRSGKVSDSTESVEGTIVHELMHALTAQTLDKHPSQLTPQQRAAKANLQALYNATMKQMRREKLPKSYFYGMKNLHEFVAEAFSDPEFQKYLDGIKVDHKTSLLDKFLSYIKEFLGIGSPNSVLAQTLETSILLFAKPEKYSGSGRSATLYKEDSHELSPESKKLLQEKTNLQVDILPSGLEGNFYTNILSGKILQRVSDTFKGFLSNFTSYKNDGRPVEEQDADRIWAEVGAEVKKPVDGGKLYLNKAEYIEWRQEMLEKGRLKGNVIHKYIELLTHNLFSQKTKEELQTELNENIKATGTLYPERAYGWVQSVLPTLLEDMGINTMKKDVAEGDKDIILSEISVGSDLLGYAGTADMLVQHPDGTYSIVDWKTSKSLNKEFEDRLMKFGSQRNFIFDNPDNRYKLQVAFYAFMMKVENPTMNFKNLTLAWIPNKYEALAFNPNQRIDMSSYMPLIESYFKQEGMQEEIRKKSPNAFNLKSYNTGKSTLESQMIKENKNASQMIEKKQTELRLLIQSKLDLRELTKTDMDTIRVLTKELVEFANDNGYAIKDWTEDISHGNRWLGTKTDISHPVIRVYKEIVEEAKDNAKKDFMKDKAMHDKLLLPVMTQYLKSKGMTGAAQRLAKVGVAGFSPTGYKDMYKFAYTLKEEDGVPIYGIKTEEDTKEWKELTEDQRKYLEFVNERFGSFFVGPDAFMNKSAYVNPETHEEETTIQLFNQGKKKLDQFEHKNGFLPIVPPTDMDIRESFGVLSKSYWKQVFLKNLTYFYDYQFEGIGVVNEAIPTRYLGNRKLRAEHLHTMNLSLTFDRYMQAMYEKKYGDNAYALSKGMQLTIKAERAGFEPSKIENLLDEFITMDLLNRTEKEFNFSRKGSLLATGDERARKLSVVKAIGSVRNYGSAAIMYLQPVRGIRNFLAAGLVTEKDALVNTMSSMKFLGIDSSARDFSTADLNIAAAQATKLFGEEMMTGTHHKNKAWLLSEEFRFKTSAYTLATDDQYTMSVKKQLLGQDNMYLFHSLPEEVLATTIMIAQLRNMKVDMKDGTTKSMWELYKVEEQSDGTFAAVYTGPTRGVYRHQGELKPLKGIDSREASKLREVYKRIHGGYRRGERTALDYYVVGQLMMQFKRFLPSMLKTSFEAKGESNSLGYYKVKVDDVTGAPSQVTDKDGNDVPVLEWQARITEGRWNTLLGVFHNYALMGVGKRIPFIKEFVGTSTESYNWENLSADQKRTIIESAVVLVGAIAAYGAYYSSFSDEPDKNSWKKFTGYMIDMSVQQWNLLNTLKDVSNFTSQASTARAYKTLRATTDAAVAGFVYTGITPLKSDEAWTKDGNLKGWTEIQRGIPLVSSWYEFVRFLENTGEDENSTHFWRGN